jgi:hypothetical protein
MSDIALRPLDTNGTASILPLAQLPIDVIQAHRLFALGRPGIAVDESTLCRSEDKDRDRHLTGTANMLSPPTQRQAAPARIHVLQWRLLSGPLDA